MQKRAARFCDSPQTVSYTHLDVYKRQASTGSQVELVHWNSWYAAIENIINKFVEKQVPDVFSVSNDSVGIFARMGVIQPLDRFIEPEKLEFIKARCMRYGLGSYVYNGQLYGYPLFSESRLLLYRKDHFQNAGLPDPLLHPLTHESFLEVGKRLSNPEEGLYAFAPVSYTHLDVYKRQGCPGGRTRCKVHLQIAWSRPKSVGC